MVEDIGSIHRECLDHIVVLNECHLKRILRGYFAYCPQRRPRRYLELESPDCRSAQPPDLGEVIEFAAVHGLHHTYIRVRKTGLNGLPDTGKPINQAIGWLRRKNHLNQF